MGFRRMAKSFSGAILMSVAVLLCSCSDGNASANGDYVKASQTLEKAFVSFNAGDFNTAAKLAAEANENVLNIVKKYPDSDVAFKIVSDDNLNLGSVKFSHFKKNILPKLNLVADPDFAELDIAFTIALFNGNCLELVSLLNSYAESSAQNNFKKLSQKTIDKFYDKLLSDVYLQSDAKNIEARAKISAAKANLSVAFEAKKSVKAKEVKAVVSTVKDAMQVALPPIQDSQKFLKNVEKNASMANYKIEASKALLEASRFVTRTTPEFEVFSKNLNVALLNVKKISSKKLRLPALKNIILALSQIGLNAEALAEIETNPDCKDMKQDCYAVIAQNLILAGELKTSEAIVVKIENAKTRNLFYAHLADLYVEKNDFSAASAIAKKANSDALLAKISLEQVAHLWNSNNSLALKILEGVSVQSLSLESLDKFCKAVDIDVIKKLPIPLKYANRYIEIAKLLAKSNKDVALKWLGAGVVFLQNAKDNDAAILNKRICEVLILIKPQDAVLYAKKLRGRLTFNDIKNLASSAIEVGAKDEALELFNVASERVLKSKDAVALAYAMQISNIARDKILEVLKPHLPKLN